MFLFNHGVSNTRTTHPKRQKGLVVLALIAFALTTARALRGQVPLAEMYHHSWTVRDGAPSNIEFAAQGADGFLWLATDKGLYRFDGVSFTQYQPPAGSSLFSTRVDRILIAHDGSIWISYMTGFVSHIEENKLTTLTNKNGLIHSSIGAVVEDLDGRVWVVGIRGIQFIRNSKVTTFNDGTQATKGGVRSAQVDLAGNLWIEAADSLSVMRRGEDHFVPAAPAPRSCKPDQVAGILCVTKEGVSHFSLGASSVETAVVAQIPDVYSAVRTRDGSIWGRTLEAGIRRVIRPSSASAPRATPDIEQFGKRDGLSDDEATSIVEDREGSIWVTTAGGLDQFRAVPVHDKILESQVTFPANQVTGDFIIADGRLAKIDNGNVTYLYPERLKEDESRSLYRGSDGTVWLGTAHGLYRYREGRLENIPFPAEIKAKSKLPHVQSIVEDNDHALWLGIGGNGLYKYANGSWLKHGGLADVPNQVAWISLRDRTGALWFSFNTNLVSKIAEGKVTTYGASQGLEAGGVDTLAEHDGQIWMGGDTEIDVFENGQFHKLRLAGTEVPTDITGLVFSPAGDLWIHANIGLVRVTRDQLSLRDKNPDHACDFQLFTYLDGVNGIPAAWAGNPSLAFASDGLLYIASTHQHLQWINPRTLPTNPIKPGVSIVNVQSGVNSIPFIGNRITLNPRQRNVSVAYTATSLLIPERVKFRYKLIGFDKDWVDAGSRRQAFYTNLPAGRYTLQVIACNDSGLWNMAGASLAVSVLPMFRDTLWFKLCLLLGVAALVTVLFRIRLNQARRKVADRLNVRFAEREQIARDLHDTLLQSVQGLLLRFSFATKRMQESDPMKAVFVETLAQSDQVLSEGRQLIEDLNTQSRYFGTVLSSLQKIGDELGYLHPETEFVTDSQGTPRELNVLVYNDVCIFAREALSNAFRHAEAAHIWLTLRYSSESVDLEVRDDGKGIEPDVLSRGFRDGHWGLRNLKERAKRMGARCLLESSPTAGTRIGISVPANVAFVQPQTEISRGFGAWLSNLFAGRDASAATDRRGNSLPD